MNCPEISVIIPTHNNGAELFRALETVAGQDAVLGGRCRLQVIVVNDASDAASQPLLEQLADVYPQITLIAHEVQRGPAAARNTGIGAATGELISFLDADDEWPLNKLSLLLPVLEDASVDVAGGKIKYLLGDGVPELEMNYEDHENRLSHVHLGALLVRRSLFQQSLFFDESLRYSEDIDWWLRLKEQQVKIVLLEATTLLYRVHGSNMSVHKSIRELQLLNVLHKAARRRENKMLMPHIPQLKDYRIGKADPLISIILPLYNGKDLVTKSIGSVLAQTYTHWELLIIDDGSTDGGDAFIRRRFPQATMISQENAGVAAARNKGIQHARGEIIAFIDQDDEWMPDKLREQWEVLKQDPYCAFVTCNQHFACAADTVLPANFSEKLREAHRGLVPSALLIRKQVLQDVNNFDESLDVSSDFDLVRRLRNAGFQEKNVERLLLRKWYHGGNASLNKTVMRREILGLLHRQIRKL
ncbi:glycosyltransferase family 2 protein [Niabella beijingensis]|uniref:glycosyltransferase family 2 protein n=1 Tax=Niabella beijingensis TaxID=2872700 RepID=UPI001CBD5F0E|nr:glycosyltransferase [Niabella beijingensis]MBZ4187285.1 glycosyltransferase [Niabella beijingensis]